MNVKVKHQRHTSISERPECWLAAGGVKPLMKALNKPCLIAMINCQYSLHQAGTAINAMTLKCA